MSNPTATTATPASSTASLFAAGNFQVIRSSSVAGPPYPICAQFSCRGYTATRSIGPHCITIMTREKKMHENQRLGRTRPDFAAQAGLSAPVAQFLMAAAAQPATLELGAG